jgi:hypothetical protein
MMRVVIFSSSGPAEIRCLMQRIHQEVPEARVCGILYEQRGGKPLPKRISTFAKNLRDRDFWPYLASRLVTVCKKKISRPVELFLQFAHASRGPQIRHQSLEEICKELDCSLRVTNNFHSTDSLDFVRGLGADLGIVYATRILKPELFTIPRLGSINIHKRKVPDYRGGGPVGLWEMLDNQTEIGITVHQVTEKLDAGAVVNSATIPIEPYDNLTSLGLKAHVVGNDLLVRSVADFARGTLTLRPQQQGAGRMFKNPSAQLLARYERELRKRRPAYREASCGDAAKLEMAAKRFVSNHDIVSPPDCRSRAPHGHLHRIFPEARGVFKEVLPHCFSR